MNGNAPIISKPSDSAIDPAAKDAKAPELQVFISYAHEDRDLATALGNVLSHCFGKTSFKVFTDIDGIRVGGEIADEIKTKLREADVLIVLSTGNLRDSHSWCGFELGFFEAYHPGENAGDTIRGKVITICTDDAVPGPTQSRRYAGLDINCDLVNEDDARLNERILVGDKDPLVEILSQLWKATNGQRAPGRDVLEDYADQVKQFKKTVYRTFRNRIQGIRKPQKQLLIRYNSKNVDNVRQEIPAEATVTSVGDALSVFGVPEDEPVLMEVEAKEIPFLSARGLGSVRAKRLTWQKFRERVGDGASAIARCNTLSRVVVPLSTQSVNQDNSQVILSFDEARRYRVLLTTSTSFYNGDVEASVYLVETLQPTDYGDEATTLLLKGLHLVCRFRFLFLEPKSVFYALNVGTWKPEDAPTKARQLLSELDLLLTQAKQAQLDQPGQWADFVSLDELRIMSTAWYPLEVAIRNLCRAAMENAGNDEAEAKVVSQLETQLSSVVQNITPYNVSLLQAMSSNLAKLVAKAGSAKPAAPGAKP